MLFNPFPGGVENIIFLEDSKYLTKNLVGVFTMKIDKERIFTSSSGVNYATNARNCEKVFDLSNLLSVPKNRVAQNYDHSQHKRAKSYQLGSYFLNHIFDA